jgi:hypothetical protein
MSILIYRQDLLNLIAQFIPRKLLQLVLANIFSHVQAEHTEMFSKTYITLSNIKVKIHFKVNYNVFA